MDNLFEALTDHDQRVQALFDKQALEIGALRSKNLDLQESLEASWDNEAPPLWADVLFDLVCMGAGVMIGAVLGVGGAFG